MTEAVGAEDHSEVLQFIFPYHDILPVVNDPLFLAMDPRAGNHDACMSIAVRQRPKNHITDLGIGIFEILARAVENVGCFARVWSPPPCSRHAHTTTGDIAKTRWTCPHREAP